VLRLLELETSQSACICAGVLVFRVIVLLNPQIRIELDASMEEFTKLPERGPLLILFNHTSFFDFFLFSSILPLSVIMQRRVRTMMAESLFRIPLMGSSWGDHSGSFRVYFKALADGSSGLTGGESDDFSVDRSKQQMESEKIASHLQEGGGLAIAPEGTISKLPPDLQVFRKGGFGLAATHEMQIWGVVMLGCYDCWPKRAAMGGAACKIIVSLVPLVVPSVEAGSTPEEVASECQTKMQAEIERLKIRRDGAPPYVPPSKV